MDSRRKLQLALDRRRLTLRLRKVLPSTREAIGAAVRDVLRLIRASGYGRGELVDVEIALREALANAVLHGNRGSSAKKVLLRCYGNPDECLMLIVRDQGAGFDPSDVPDPRSAERIDLPHGRGLLLMRELMDHAEHRRGGREVILYKKRATRRRRGSGRTGHE